MPINVPSLAISIGEDNVDTNRELVAHGISNVASGLLGSVPNYVVYANSVLFIQSGGTTRLSGFMLALGSVGVLLAGPGLIGFLPVCVVSALIFILGIDLVKEAVWDTYHRVSSFEYATIWIIILTMTAFDFTIGLAVGLILACVGLLPPLQLVSLTDMICTAQVSFVVMSSQRRAIRSILSGSSAHSTVRRHPKQSAWLADVGRQIRIVKLQGFLFFGTISNVEATVRKLLDAASWSDNPIRFLVVDFSMASGASDSSAQCADAHLLTHRCDPPPQASTFRPPRRSSACSASSTSAASSSSSAAALTTRPSVSHCAASTCGATTPRARWSCSRTSTTRSRCGIAASPRRCAG